jgi:cation/acetate symporter
MAAGAGVTAAYAAMTVSGGLAPLPVPGLTDVGISAAASGLLGVPLGFVVAIAVSLVTKAPSLARREVTDAIRRPNPDPILEDHAT